MGYEVGTAVKAEIRKKSSRPFPLLGPHLHRTIDRAILRLSSDYHTGTEQVNCWAIPTMGLWRRYPLSMWAVRLGESHCSRYIHLKRER